MGKNVAQKLIEAHLVDGKMQPGEEIGLKIDQTLTQDATGTMVMLEFEAMGIPRVKTEISAQYVDHNLLQTDFKNADDPLELLPKVRCLVQPSGKRGEPSGSYGTIWGPGKDHAGIGQPYHGGRIFGDAGHGSRRVGGGHGNGRRTGLY